LVEERILSNIHEEKYKGKTQVIAGEKSPYFKHEDWKYFKDIFEDFSDKTNLAIIKDAGHWVHFDKPHEFLDNVSDFLGKVN